ncbi:MAG: hypothetical protein CMG74_02755 [Candidatus Marinimicrobia bacterium]|nr:hypothetical protein [Candidatus Neomarinimicrobiota bacterium]|tara:strand:+ start:1255 stop:1758 length:504 start_codon:yes stop_codon:yes gene_type:complete
MKNKIKVIVFLFNILFSQDSNISELKSQYEDYQVSSERYLTNANGSIMMNVNIWGHVKSPGSHIVYDGIDFASLLSVVGGPMDGAKLKDVRLYREIPDKDGTIVYNIDLSEFIKTGNRSEFIKIKPNDTIIVPYKLSSYLLKQINFVNTIFNIINIYLQLEYIVSNR